MNNRVSRYIDTDELGLVVQINHNLGAMVYPYIYRVNLSGHKIFASLYDPAIAEVKLLDDNIAQISFAASFQGYVDLVEIDVSGNSYNKRLSALEKEILELQETITKLTNSAQWKQMNTYIFSQIDGLKADLAELSSSLSLLQQEVSEL